MMAAAGLTRAVSTGSFEQSSDSVTDGAYRNALIDLATMVGALILARATRNLAISDGILRAARESRRGRTANPNAVC